MWTYVQRTGALRDKAGRQIAEGYAGRGPGKNNPAAQSQRNVGPLPCGLYTMQKPIGTKDHGPFVMWLTPDPANTMFGRSAFGIHGDSLTHPGEASNGCIILPRAVRQEIWDSGDHTLRVVAEEK